ncbi:MAG: selenoneine synthase SenA [Gammaproteobacteria bacterium]
MNYQDASVDSISKALLDVRARTLALVEGLSEKELMGKVLPTVNPLKWEIAHAAYFHETWVLRHLGGQSAVNDKADELFDSINISHEERWDLPLPSLVNTFEYMDNVLQQELVLLNNIELNNYAKYFYLLALFHEDMHNEAFICTRQTLSYPKPNFVGSNQSPSSQNSSSGHINEDIQVPGGSFLLGAERKDEFIFDNEKWAHSVNLSPFKIAKYAVTNEQYLEFVEDCGYQKEQYWCDESWAWCKKESLEHPVYWKKDSDGEWYVKMFDQYYPIELNHAVIHVSWYEVKAFCEWSARRLPTESEWEFAATCNPNVIHNNQYQKDACGSNNDMNNLYANLDCLNLGTTGVSAYPKGDSVFGCRQMFGNVWEWTESTFKPYPGFSPGWYSEYSRPLFNKAKVLRGGAWTTRSRMLRGTLRNYYGPHRNDVFAGFRTCAIN